MTLSAPQAPVEQARLIGLAQEGDRAALEELARRARRLAYTVALGLTGNREDAADLTQDAMVRFFNALGRFDRGRPLKPWLLRIVRNLYRDRMRRRRVRRVTALEEITEATGNDPVEESPGPEALASRRELQRLVWAALQELPDHYREVIVLRDYHGLAYAEIARVLRLPRGTIMSRLHRGRRMLRRRVLESSGGPSREGGKGR